ncbi:MAG: uroporphyrinogen-III synthase [Thermoproteus sp. AZ2]|uniref:Uroporphyrinogen-III synthase n=1 Tax=Thermoproteus sp. AZ2 TaxID=1609232 RepID=A0ACC6V149_9CREN
MRTVVVRIKEGPCPEGAECISIGTIKPRPYEIPDGDYLVVMSPAVAKFVDIERIRRRFRCVICVGPSTAEAVGSCAVPREYSSYGVAKLLEAMAPGRVVVLRSSAGNDVLRRLVPGVVEVAIYDVEIDEERLTRYAPAIAQAEAVVLTSATVARAVAKAVDLAGKTVVAIGPVTSKALSELGISHVVAEESTIEKAVETARRGK